MVTRQYNLNKDGSYMNANQILADLPKRLDAEMIKIIKNNFKEEPDPRSPNQKLAEEWVGINANNLKTSLGRWIRNSYGLWQDNNPYTCQRIRNLSGEQQAESEFHPDNFSGKLLDRLVEHYRSQGDGAV